MSSMLEQAIVDAKSLREAAIKNAEETLVEKYSDEIAQNVMPIMQAQMQQRAQLQQKAQMQAQMQLQSQKEASPSLQPKSVPTQEEINQHKRETAEIHPTLGVSTGKSATINGGYQAAGPFSHFHG